MSKARQLAAQAVNTVSATARTRPFIRCAVCSKPLPQSTSFQGQRRHLTSSPSSSGVRKWFTHTPPSRTPPAAIEDKHAEFIKAISTTSLTSLRSSYDALYAQHIEARSKLPSPNKHIPASEQIIQRGELMNAMTFLSGRSEGAALALLKRIYSDLDQWGHERLPKHSRAVLRGICNVGQMEEAIRWVDESEGDVDDWRIVLKGAVRHDMSLVPDIEVKIKARAEESGRNLSAADYALFLRHLRFDQSEGIDVRGRLRELFAETKSKGIWITEDGEVELVHIHLGLDDIGRAGKIVEKWKLGNDPILWNTMLDFRMARNEIKGVEESLIRMKELGLTPYLKALGYLVLRRIEKEGSADIVRIVDDVEVRYGAKVPSASWGKILDGVENLDERMRLYQEVRDRGVLIDTHIAKSLIFPLCALDPPNLSSALDIYKDLSSRSQVITSSSVRNRLLAIYSTLFRAHSYLGESADPSTPITLLKDMRRFGLSLPTPILTSLVISLIRASPDHYAAFNNYAHLYALNPLLIDSKAYTAIINAFIAHSTQLSPFANPSYVMEMIKDMRKAGYPPSPSLLTTLLSNYGSQAIKSRKSSSDPVYRQTKLDALHKAITEIHNTLKLESIITPDIPLYNALMEAYARIGAYSASFEVWELLVERRPHVPKGEAREAYGPSISIILDACGRAGQLVRARRIWGWVKKHHLVETGDGPRGKVWEGWVECLCRLGQVEEAMELVLERENPEMLRILLKFSWMDKGVYRNLPDRVAEKYPEMWANVGKKYKKGHMKRSWDPEEYDL